MSQDFSKIAENIANSTNASYSYSPETELLLYLASVLIFVIAIVFAAVKLKRPHRLNFINLVLLAEYLWVVAYSNNSEFQLLYKKHLPNHHLHPTIQFPFAKTQIHSNIHQAH